MISFIEDEQTRECLVLKSRRASRAITRRYNALLKPFNIQSTQASLLFVVARGGFKSISELAEIMAIERSALTRNISLLRDMGLLSSGEAGQGKAQRVELTEAGCELFENISPLWVQAQRGVREEIGQENWDKLQNALSLIGDLKE